MKLFQTEPVALGVGTLAGLVDAFLIMANALDWVDLTNDQTAAIIAFVTTLSLVVGAILRATVWSPDSVAHLTTPGVS